MLFHKVFGAIVKEHLREIAFLYEVFFQCRPFHNIMKLNQIFKDFDCHLQRHQDLTVSDMDDYGIEVLSSFYSGKRK